MTEHESTSRELQEGNTPGLKELIQLSENESKVLIPEEGDSFSKAMYYGMSGNFLTGRNPEFYGFSGLHFGLGLQVFSGYQFSHYFAIGAGVGLDILNESSFATAFIDLRGDLFPHRNFPTFNLQIGINHLLSRLEENGLVDKKSGFLIYPSIGIRLLNTEPSRLQLDIGYKIRQYSTTTTAETSYYGTIITVANGLLLFKNITSRSLALRLSWIF